MIDCLEGEDCEQSSDILKTKGARPAASRGCTCLTSLEGECSCSGAQCSEEERSRVCTELLGPCVCERFEDGVCECSGHCHTETRRKEACHAEPGCSWSGDECEAQ